MIRTALCYVYPTVQAKTYVPLARRFATSYMEHWPGAANHALHVLFNGPEPSDAQLAVLAPLPFRALQHDNIGRDIGAYQGACGVLDCDLMLCFGAGVHFHRSGWLDRLLAVYTELGPGLYGCWGSPYPNSHVRTTAFWLPPQLLRSYPKRVTNGARYEFERGRDESILYWVTSQGFAARAVGWTRVDTHPNFGLMPPSEYLLLDQHCLS